MSTDIQKLMSPDSMSEEVLIEILKSRCIEIPNFKTLRKPDLIEMFRRIAFPMPQRRYKEDTYLGKKLSDLRSNRKINIATEEDEKLYQSAISSQRKLSNQLSNERIRPACDDGTSQPKKINLSNSSNNTINGLSENGLKRKINDREVPAQNESRKRQKITWP